MKEIYSGDTYSKDVVDSSVVELPDILSYGPKTGPMDWILALYLIAVSALESTVYFKYSTYFAYFVFVSFFINILFTFSTNRGYAQVFKMAGFWLLVGFLVWCYFVALTTEPRTRLVALFGTWFITKIHLMALIFMIRCDSLGKFFLYLKALVVGAMVVAVSGAVLGYGVAGGSRGSMLGITEHSNAFGISLFIGMISSLILLPIANKKWKIFIGAYFIGTFISLLVSASRGSLVSCAMAIMAYFLLEYIRHFKNNIKMIIPFVTSIILAPMIAIKFFPYSPLVLKMTGLVYGDPDATHGRLEIYEKTWSMFLSDPFKGIGIGTFNAYTQFSYTHTTVMEILVTVGLVGFVLYYGFYLCAWRMLSKLKNAYAEDNTVRKIFNACKAVLLAITAYGAFTVVIYQKGTTFIIAMMLGVGFRLYLQMKQHRRGMSLNCDELDD